MKNLIIYSLLTFFIVGCSTRKKSVQLDKSDDGSIQITQVKADQSSIRGKIIDENGEGVIGAAVVLIKDGVTTNMGAMTDIDGNFRLEKLTSGIYDLEVNYIGYNSEKIENIKIPNDGSVILDVKKIEMKPGAVLLKPIIYLYPEQTTEVSVEIDYQGNLIHTYPKYAENGWNVTAYQGGKIFDQNNKEYYALYWEGVPNKNLSIPNGNVVKGSQTVEFLEEKLSLLGLNRREANEFIVFWLPRLEVNPYNVIHFSSSEYEAQAPLNIVPEPETIIRVMMVFQPLNNPVEIPKQVFPSKTPERKGFTVVEWGGSQVKQFRNI